MPQSITFQCRFATSILRAMESRLLWLLVACALAALNSHATVNLLQNPGFEAASGNITSWNTRDSGQGIAVITNQPTHEGKRSVAIPAGAAIEQTVEAKAGAYLARCWVKSEADQTVSFILQDTNRPWAGYTYADFKVPKNQWVSLEVFCTLDRDGSLALMLGGFSKIFRSYHGTEQEMSSPILADAFELVRCEPKPEPNVSLWDANQNHSDTLDWSARDQWSKIQDQTHSFNGSAVFKARHLAGEVLDNGSVAIYAIDGTKIKKRAVITPSTRLPHAKTTLVKTGGKTGVCVASDSGSYTAWITPAGLITIEADRVPQFTVHECKMRFGLLPSFVGTDLRYSPDKFSGLKQVNIPSTKWFVGLIDGNDSMLVAAWDSDQKTTLGLSGEGTNQLFDSFSIATDKAGFSLSFVEHANIWHREALKEDWLGEYTTIDWERPFQARWMGQFFVTPGGAPSFQRPCMDYSFPIACARTRMWGTWFEDWNRYPFFFEGARTVLHFEKTFVPTGDALLYFLEPAAENLYSPCEIVEQALGKEKAAALFDFDANQLRRLNYSTPNEFLFDRPVCATTTRLSQITKAEKTKMGIQLATHLYEFIREIRGRVDQYAAFFAETKDYLAAQKQAQPQLSAYISELEILVNEAQAKTTEIYRTPLPDVLAKIDGIKKRLQEGNTDGFDCQELDVRTPAGDQDDVCRRCSRVVLRLSQAAAFKCADSPEKAVIATHIWEKSRAMLRQPTRWESRRTLYFFEP